MQGGGVLQGRGGGVGWGVWGRVLVPVEGFRSRVSAEGCLANKAVRREGGIVRNSG
jgi:hypothetical protein